MGKPSVMLGAESLLPGNGGICRVARLIGRVLAEEVAAGRLGGAAAVALSDKSNAGDVGIPVTGRSGSRPRFVADMAAAAVGGRTHFIYDFIGMARAHCRLPLLRRPMQVYLHGIEVWDGVAAKRVGVANRADALLVNSAYTLERAQRLHGRFRVEPRVCWLATEADDAPPPPPPGASAGPPTVMILARMDEGGGYKGHLELIPAWAKVARAIPDARLLVVGGGPGRGAIAALAAASPAASSIKMCGFVPDAEVERLWAETTALVMPSRKEGFGLVYIEAMRHAVPVIASVHDAATEVNVDGQTGFNVDLDSGRDELADRIIDLLRDRDAAAAMGRRGRERWGQHFRYSAFRDRFRPALADFLH
jgi:phosphatidylinositol alpha-1,6-mannosyltransferase